MNITNTGFILLIILVSTFFGMFINPYNHIKEEEISISDSQKESSDLDESENKISINKINMFSKYKQGLYLNTTKSIIVLDIFYNQIIKSKQNKFLYFKAIVYNIDMNVLYFVNIKKEINEITENIKFMNFVFLIDGDEISAFRKKIDISDYKSNSEYKYLKNILGNNSSNLTKHISKMIESITSTIENENEITFNVSLDQKLHLINLEEEQLNFLNNFNKENSCQNIKGQKFNNKKKFINILKNLKNFKFDDKIIFNINLLIKELEEELDNDTLSTQKIENIINNIIEILSIENLNKLLNILNSGIYKKTQLYENFKIKINAILENNIKIE